MQDPVRSTRVRLPGRTRSDREPVEKVPWGRARQFRQSNPGVASGDISPQGNVEDMQSHQGPPFSLVAGGRTGECNEPRAGNLQFQRTLRENDQGFGH